MENGIFGFHPWAVLLFAVIAIMGFIIFSSGKSANKKKLKYEHKLIVLFLANTGAKFYLCEEEHGEIVLPEEFKKKSDTVSGFVRLPRSSKDKDEETPQMDRYYVQPIHKYDIFWPPERRAKDQVSMKLIVYMEGVCLPIAGVMMDKWTSEMLTTLASDLIGATIDKDAMKAFNAQDSGFWNNLEWIRKKIMKMDMMQIACFVAAGAAAIALFMLLQLSSKIDALSKLFIGG